MGVNLRKGQIRVLLALIVLTTLSCLFIENEYREESSYQAIEEENLNFTILIQEGASKRAGVRSSLIYYILDDFEKRHNCKVNLSIREDELERWQELMEGEVNALIINGQEDTVPASFQESVVSTIAINENEDLFVLTRESYTLMQSLNFWISYYKQTPEYKRLSRRYKGTTKGFAPAISPYDPIIRKYSKELGWDWRLLAALIYTESKFQGGVSSSRGAIGLMQIKEHIAKEFGIDDIYEPENNIKAGVLYIKRLMKMYRRMGVDSTNVVPITLAAYNCGEGRMEDCMNVARTEGKDPLVWENIKEIIPLMSGKEFSRREDVKLGAFRGKETILHVEKIFEKFEAYKVTVRE